MGVRLNDITCFLPFNNSVTEDLTGNTTWQVVNNIGYGPLCSIVSASPSSGRKILYLKNMGPKSTPIYMISTSNKYIFGTNDFTISFWFRKVTNDIEQSFFFIPTSDIGLYWTNTANGLCVSTTTTGLIKYPDNGSLGFEWHHVAVIRIETTLYLYLDGVNVGTYNIGSTSFTGDTIRIGQWILPSGKETTNGCDFFMSEFIIDNGHAWYTEDFTPVSFLDNKLLNNLSLSE